MNPNTTTNRIITLDTVTSSLIKQPSVHNLDLIGGYRSLQLGTSLDSLDFSGWKRLSFADSLELYENTLLLKFDEKLREIRFRLFFFKKDLVNIEYEMKNRKNNSLSNKFLALSQVFKYNSKPKYYTELVNVFGETKEYDYKELPYLLDKNYNQPYLLKRYNLLLNNINTLRGLEPIDNGPSLYDFALEEIETKSLDKSSGKKPPAAIKSVYPKTRTSYPLNHPKVIYKWDSKNIGLLMKVTNCFSLDNANNSLEPIYKYDSTDIKINWYLKKDLDEYKNVALEILKKHRDSLIVEIESEGRKRQMEKAKSSTLKL